MKGLELGQFRTPVKTKTNLLQTKDFQAPGRNEVTGSLGVGLSFHMANRGQSQAKEPRASS